MTDPIVVTVNPPPVVEVVVEPPPVVEVTVAAGAPVPGPAGDPATLFDSDPNGRLILSGGGPNDTSGA